jgi:alpha-glucosidase
LRDLGPRTIWLSATRAARTELRDRLAGNGPLKPPSLKDGLRGFQARLGPICSVEVEGARGRVCFRHAQLELEALAPWLVRIWWNTGTPPLQVGTRHGKRPVEKVSVRLVRDGAEGTHEGTTGAGTPVEMQLAPAGMSIVIFQDGTLELRSSSGELLRRELPPMIGPKGWSQVVELPTEARVHGLGERAFELNLVPPQGVSRAYRFFNKDPGGNYSTGADPLYCGIPVYISLGANGSSCSLCFEECTWEGWVQLEHALDRSVKAVLSFAGGSPCRYVFEGPAELVLPRYAELTGKPPLPPRWALGYHQCRWGYKSARQVREVIQGFKQRGIPLSALHLDIDYMDHYRVFTVSEEGFGRLAGLAELCRELGEEGIALVAIIDPGVHVQMGPAGELTGELASLGLEEGVFLTDGQGKPVVGTGWPGDALFPDFANQAVQRWWGERYEALLRAGVAGFWHDMNEPTLLALFGDRTLPRSTLHRVALTEGFWRTATHDEIHNVYGLFQDQATFEALQARMGERRPWILSRSGWAGVGAVAWLWTGDAETSWASLRQQVRTLQGLSMSGVFFVGCDIGGFSGAPGAELYLRWLELGCCLPLCRTHSSIGSPPREPWRFSAPVEHSIAQLVTMRERLVEHLYTLAWETSTFGVPFLRPWWWGTSGSSNQSSPDPSRGETDGVFFIGDDLLACPVTQPMGDGGPLALGAVALPEGRWWVPGWGEATAGVGDIFFSKHQDGGSQGSSTPCYVEVGRGGGWAELRRPLGTLPVLVRGGAVIALGPSGSRGRDSQEDVELLTELHVYPDSEQRAKGRLYEDAGDGYGPSRLYSFEMRLAGDQREGASGRPSSSTALGAGRCKSALADFSPADFSSSEEVVVKVHVEESPGKKESSWNLPKTRRFLLVVHREDGSLDSGHFTLQPASGKSFEISVALRSSE